MRRIELFVLLAGTFVLHPQTCEPSSSSLHTLDQLQSPDDLRVSAAGRQPRKVEILRKALDAAPGDVFLHEEYQRIRIGGIKPQGRRPHPLPQLRIHLSSPAPVARPAR